MVAMVMAIPDVKPSVTGNGMYSISRPSRHSPISSKKTPESRVATSSPERPNCCDTGLRMTTNAAVGPDTL
ncbi:hypothetical protein OS31_33750 [Dickeya oryzae]